MKKEIEVRKVSNGSRSVWIIDTHSATLPKIIVGGAKNLTRFTVDTFDSEDYEFADLDENKVKEVVADALIKVANTIKEL